jgi:predicted transcriptional regulator of viral defense system
MTSHPAGISGQGRAELTSVLSIADRFITPRDVTRALDVGPDAATKRLSRWATDGWLRRVRRGLYIPVPVDAPSPRSWSQDALTVAAEVYSPCYFTGWTAAQHWSLTEQVFRTTVLKTSQRVRRTSVHLLDHEYLVGHVSDAALAWGMTNQWSDGTRLPFADPTRTIVDLLDSPRLGGGIRHVSLILAAYLDDHDPKALVDYGDRLGNRTVFKRLGHLVEALGVEAPDLLTACSARVPSGISLLDPDGPSQGHRVMRWGLQVNVAVTPDRAS